MARASTVPGTPRRLAHGARHDQLVLAALPLLARAGPLSVSLDDVAERAGVTRNLLYHYFPAGRVGLLAAVVEEAERQLLGDRSPARSPEQPPGARSPEELDDALSRVLDHALAPTHAWRVHRLARGMGDPVIAAIIQSTTEEVASALAALHPGDRQPEAELALRAYVDFAESVLDGARLASLPRAEIRRLLSHVLRAVVSTD